MSQPDIKIINLSLDDFILEKVRALNAEIHNLKQQYVAITGKAFPLDDLENEEPVVKDGFVFPSKKDILLIINKWIKENDSSYFKTSDIINANYQNIEDKSVKEDLIRRFSGVIGGLVKDNKLYKKRIPGERGDIYADNIEKLNMVD